jgi:hypothetical protein
MRIKPTALAYTTHSEESLASGGKASSTGLELILGKWMSEKPENNILGEPIADYYKPLSPAAKEDVRQTLAKYEEWKKKNGAK